MKKEIFSLQGNTKGCPGEPPGSLACRSLPCGVTATHLSQCGWVHPSCQDKDSSCLLASGHKEFKAVGKPVAQCSAWQERAPSRGQDILSWGPQRCRDRDHPVLSGSLEIRVREGTPASSLGSGMQSSYYTVTVWLRTPTAPHPQVTASELASQLCLTGHFSTSLGWQFLEGGMCSTPKDLMLMSSLPPPLPLC